MSSMLPSLPLWVGVPQQNGCFVGRDKLLEAIKTYMFPASGERKDIPLSTRVLVLYGMGGTGKTRAATMFAAQFKASFSAVVWVDGSTEQNTLLSLRSFAQCYVDTVISLGGPEGYQALSSRLRIGEYVSSTFQLSMDSEALPKIAQAVLDFLSVDDDNFPWLLILDNVDDAGYPTRKYMPQSSGGSIIITSRRTAAAELGWPLQVEVIDEGEAAQIILENAPFRSPTSSDTSDAKAIARELGCLPLALELAGAFISDTQIKLSEYLPRLKKDRRDVLSFCKTWSSSPSALATWEISFERLASQHPEAAELLILLGFLDRQMVWEDMFLAKSIVEGDPFQLPPDLEWLLRIREDPYSLTKAFRNLFVSSLAKRNPEGFVSLHPLVHTWARERLDRVDRVKRNVQAVIVIGQIIESQTATLSASLFKLLPHAQTCMDLICEADKEEIIKAIMECPIAVRSFYHTGVLMKRSGSLLHAELIFTSISRGPSAGPSLLTLNSERRLGELLTLQSRYSESKDLLERVQGLQKHSDTLAAQTALGMVYRRTYQFEDAEACLLSVLKHDTDPSGSIEKYGRDLLDNQLAQSPKAWMLHISTRTALADALVGAGSLDDAKETLEPALLQSVDLIARESPVSLMIQMSSARLALAQGEIEAARSRLETCLEFLPSSLGSNHPQTAQARSLCSQVSAGTAPTGGAQSTW